MLSLHADRSLIRAQGASVRFLLASITAPAAPARTERMPVNVSFALDRSGSMAGDDKFPLAVEAVRKSLDLLHDDDRFSLVVFDDRVDVLAPSLTATPGAKRRALRALEQVAPRGSTNMCSAWMLGAQELADHIAEGTTTRVLLLTDGLANAGETDRGKLVHHATELKRRGIATSCFGVGADFDEVLLRDISREGGGNFWFIQRSAQIVDLVTSELGEALEVVVPSATLALALPPEVRAEVLGGFRARRSENRTGYTVELGDLVSEQELELVFRLTFPAGAVDTQLDVVASINGEERRQAFTFATHAANDEQPRDRRVDREVGRQYVARARAEATEANRHGDYDRAHRVLTGTSRRIMEYAGDDAELRAMARGLRSEMVMYTQAPMSAMELKASFYVAETAMRYRTSEGKARRG
ncbi:MAG: VWA domain-containing protein [Gemmatimonadaceae bacterium]